MPCASCGADVGPTYLRCPSCGAKLRQRRLGSPEESVGRSLVAADSPGRESIPAGAASQMGQPVAVAVAVALPPLPTARTFPFVVFRHWRRCPAGHRCRLRELVEQWRGGAPGGAIRGRLEIVSI